MIYALYLAGLKGSIDSLGEYADIQFKGVNKQKMVGEFIRKNPQHKFIMVTTVDQAEDRKKFIKEAGLEGLSTTLWPEGITNANYPERKRRLRMDIFQGKGE